LVNQILQNISNKILTASHRCNLIFHKYYEFIHAPIVLGNAKRYSRRILVPFSPLSSLIPINRSRTVTLLEILVVTIMKKKESKACIITYGCYIPDQTADPPIGSVLRPSRTVIEGVLHIMQAAYGFSMHNEACRRRTNNKARAVIRYIWRAGPSSCPFNTAKVFAYASAPNDLAIRHESQFSLNESPLQIALNRVHIRITSYMYRKLLLWLRLFRDAIIFQR